MRLKKILSFVLVLILSVMTFAACTGNSESEESSVQVGSEESAAAETQMDNGTVDNMESSGITFPLEETMTFTGFAGMYGDVALSDNYTWQTILERANIQIELTNVLGSELTEKRNLTLSGGSYPDIFYKSNFSSTDVETYGSQGILIPLEDLMREYAPNLCALLDETDGWDYITSSDGHVYSFPYQMEKKPLQPFWINTRWLDNLGLKVPTSYEELYEVLKAFKEQDANGNGDPNDEIPYACDSSKLMSLLEYEDYLLDFNTYLGIRDGELFYVPTDESFREYIAYMTKLYKEGLMNTDCFTIDHNQMRSGGSVDDVYGFFSDEASFTTVGRDNDEDYVMLTPFSEGTFPLNAKYNTGGLVITDSCEHPEIIVAWADQFYTEAGGILAWMGIEGETYEMNEDDTWNWITGTKYGDDISTVRSYGTLQGNYSLPAIQPELWKKMSAESDEDEVYLNSERWRIYDMGAVFPVLSYTSDESSELTTYKTDIDSYISEYLAQVVTGQLTLEDSWDNYLDTLKQMGVEEMFSIYQASYERTKG